MQMRYMGIALLSATLFGLPAIAQTTTDLRSKLTKACDAAFRELDKPDPWTGKPKLPRKTETRLGVNAVLAAAETEFKYAKTAAQRGVDDNKVLACRITQPGSTCVPDPHKQFKDTKLDLGYDESVLFANDAPARRIRQALLRLLQETGQPVPSSARASRVKHIGVRWTDGVCSATKCPVISETSEAYRELFDAATRKHADDDQLADTPRKPEPTLKEFHFKYLSERLEEFISGEGSAEVVCYRPKDPDLDLETTPSLVLNGLDYLAVGGAGLAHQTWGGVTNLPLPGVFQGAETDENKTNPFKVRDENASEKDRRFKRSIMVLKDASQFAAAEPEGFKLGTNVAGDGGLSDFKIDAAIGLSFKRSDPVVSCKQPSECASLGLAGNDRQYTFYTAYSQSPSTEKVFDETKLQFDVPTEDPAPTILPLDQGEFPVKSETFSDGVLRAGFRIDYQYVPWFTNPRAGEKWWQYPAGERPIGSKSSLAIETLTDNELDLQANRLEHTFTPGTRYLYNVEGFRRPIVISDGPWGMEFKWSANSVIDAISYARRPLNRDVTNTIEVNGVDVVPERRNVSDFMRVGFDASAELRGRVPFALPGDTGWWTLAYKAQQREALSGKNADAGGDQVSLSLQDILGSNWKFSITYANETNPITLNDSEVTTISAELKLK